jgi:basic membrane lipoprotein Med (substrate-binding protein (PBP1-ABC) superfamily)
MTYRILSLAGLLAVTVFGAVQTAPASPERRVVVVVDAAAGRDPAVLAEARSAVQRAGGEAQLRVPRTATEQLSVTHYFAARGYSVVVGVGLDHPVAISPVAARFPNTRFVTVTPGQVGAALAF